LTLDRILCVAALLVTLVTPFTAVGDENSSMRPRADLAKSLPEIRAAAERGEPEGQLQLGLAYLRGGVGVEKDVTDALAWWRKAAEQGHAGAQGLLGIALREGTVVPQDLPAAARWLALSAERGFVTSQTNLGNLYMRGEGVSQDLDLSQGWLRRGARAGDTVASKNLILALILAESRSERFTPEQRVAAEKRVTWTGNDASTVALMTTLAERDHLAAQLYLVRIYHSVLRDEAMATKWVTRAAVLGDETAQLDQALSYLRGTRQPLDDVAGIKWLTRSATLGNARSQIMLGTSYMQGRRVPEERWLGLAWIARAAGQEDKAAKEEMKRFVPTYGTPPDPARKKLNEILLRAVESGHQRYFTRVPDCLSFDFPKFDRVPRAQAAAGDPLAELWLAHWHGARLEFPQQAEWSLRAAKKGLAEAQANLGDIYSIAKGFPADRVQAYLWLTLAIRNGHTDAAWNRRVLAKEMSEREVQEATRLAIEWRPEYSN
jgi:TPR repeat protein